MLQRCLTYENIGVNRCACKLLRFAQICRNILTVSGFTTKCKVTCAYNVSFKGIFLFITSKFLDYQNIYWCLWIDRVIKAENVKIRIFGNDTPCRLENSSRQWQCLSLHGLGLIDPEEGGITFLRNVSNFTMRYAKHTSRHQSYARNV